MQAFYLNVPGLPQGDYIIRLDGPTPVDVPLRIAPAVSASVPALDSSAASTLIALLLAFAIFQLRPTLNGNRYRHG